MTPLRRLVALNPVATGGLLCGAGFVFLALPPLIAAAVGLELMAAGFWVWARAAEDRVGQLPRWAWMRRPASALWLATGLHAVIRDTGVAGAPVWPTPAGAIVRFEALAVLWAALELMAALPLARPFSDRPGPLRTTGPWLPVMLPAAGFTVAWRHAGVWAAVPEVRSAAIVLLLVTAVLAALRAFSRRQWTVSLRWLVVVDCSLGGVVLALRVVPAESALLLWLGACGAHALLLAGELSGATPRRGVAPRLWRLAAWTALASLSWPVLATLGFAREGWASRVLALAAAFAVTLAAWVSVRRLIVAPERRAMVRREAAVSLIQLGALGTLACGPVALIFAWWAGFEPGWRDSLAALAPAIAGGWGAGLGGAYGLTRVRPRVAALGEPARRAAQRVFAIIVRVERRLVALLARIASTLVAPARDLHTGDAQEYLLFVVGLAVLALVLPLLR
ncbi:MAG: hypothetical protein HY076_02165 [Candidatus Eisenbacteria bacterium]|uniref:Uncharacterized protein n=1 Tax=Eiseniibacteriota bacterium TaxID=2212470 RepID=A0A9D6QI96_UNCEI|nr:hypothetical protein [Candidatus Eisenbacteria bacterium]MBI3539062.1 hypothetical protein [Candidatus Eisenbacteria bacterium]